MRLYWDSQIDTTEDDWSIRTVTGIISPDTLAPLIEEIARPSDTVSVGDTVYFEVEVTDNDTLSRVEIGILSNTGYLSQTAMDTIEHGSYRFSFIVPETGRYSYWYEAEDFWENVRVLPAQGEYTFVTDDYIDATDGHPTMIEDYSVSVYPNPFNPSTTISFSLPKAQQVRVAMYDLTGRLVRVLVDQRMSAGEHRVAFDGAGLASGIYFARMEAGTEMRVRKMVLLR